MDLSKLKKEIPYQWRVQSFSPRAAKAACVAYIDARDVMNLLDEVCGAASWQSDFKNEGSQIFGGIGINVPVHPELPTDKERHWVWKWDTGSESNVEAEKGQASDAFKRAAVKWGIGRFLYDLPVKYVKSNAPKNESNKFPYVVDDSGKQVYDLTKHIRNS